MKFNTDSKELLSALNELRDLVNREGAILHPEIAIDVNGNDFQVLSKIDPDIDQTIFFIPNSCLPSLNDFDCKIKKGKIFCKAKNDQVPKTQVRALELMIELYNLTDKLQEFQKVTPYQHIRSKTIQNIFSEIDTERNPDFEMDFDRKDKDILLHAFFATRTMRFSRPNGEERDRVLMPLIDYINHSSLANQALEADEGEDAADGITISHWKYTDDGDECYICYNYYDAFSTYVTHGFVDESTQYVRSLPMTIKLDGIRNINVEFNDLSEEASSIPQVLKNITFYYPKMTTQDRDNVLLSQLLIPDDSAPRSLRRILEVLIKNFSPINLSREEMEDRVLSAEEQVLTRNQLYYEKLFARTHQVLEKLENADKLNDGDIESHQALISLCEYQLEKIEDYRNIALELPLSYLQYSESA